MKIRWFLGLAVCSLILSLVAPLAWKKWDARLGSPASLARSTAPVTSPPPAYIRSLRPNYPYSVIPGGAYNPQELRSANGKDDVVRAHYADFQLKDARVVKLTADRFAYVSYRLNNHIYWTAKKLRIPQGEYLLTDGAHYARARCGNRLSEEPRETISALEPPAGLLSQPAFRPNLLSELDLPATPGVAAAPEIAGGSSPRFAPVLPPNTVLLEQAPELAAASPAIPVGIAPPITGVTARPPSPPSAPWLPPPTSGSIPNTPPGEVTPPDTPAAPSPVPEPASIYLFLITFVVVLGLLTRIMNREEKSDS